MFNVMKRQVDAFSCALILNDAALSTKSRAHDSLIGYCVFVSIAFQSKLLSIHSGKLERERVLIVIQLCMVGIYTSQIGLCVGG